MKTCKPVFPTILMNLCILAWTGMLSGNLVAASQRRSEQTSEKPVVQVQAKYVCMINNQRFDKEQIPIAVEGRTYYGCCAMCKEKLQKDPKSRTALDPVSGKKVDKAKAVIGANSDGQAFYFENEENMKRFNKS